MDKGTKLNTKETEMTILTPAQTALKRFVIKEQENQDINVGVLVQAGFDFTLISDLAESGILSAINGYDALGNPDTLFFA